MRKIFLFMMITADGYFEGPNHDLSWHNVDDEFIEFAVRQLDEADTLIFGRKTYELMAKFWPTDYAAKTDPATAERMNSYRKIVFSRSMKSASWNNTVLHHDQIDQVLMTLQKQAGRDIAVFGSSNLCLTLLEKGLIDEIRLMINPTVLGKGTPLFAGLKKPLRLSLQKTTNFESGNVLLTYRPVG